MSNEQVVIIKRNVEFVFSLIASILGFGSGVFVFLFGGIASAFGASGMIMVLGISGILFAIIGFVACAIVKHDAKFAGTMMIIAGLGGAIVNGGFYFLPAILFWIAGIMALVKKDKGYKFTKTEKLKVGITAIAGIIIIVLLMVWAGNVDKNNTNKGIFSDNNSDLNKTCISLNQFHLSKYTGYGDYDFQVNLKSDSAMSFPEVSGYTVKIDNDFSSNIDFAYCKKGSSEGENPNYYYCGTFLLSKNILNTDGTIKEKETLYERMVFDSSSLQYIKTECLSDSFMAEKIGEVN